MSDKGALRDRRKEELEKADAIVGLTETEARGMSADEKAAFDAHMGEAKRLADEVEAISRADVAKAEIDEAKRYDVPEVVARTVAHKDDEARAARDAAANRVEVPESDDRRYQRGDALGAIVSARMRFGAWEHNKAIRWAEQSYGGRSYQARALQQTSFTDGGALIPENFVVREFIEMLRATAKVRQAGARQVALVNGSFTTPKMTGGATGYWIDAEGSNITPSQPTFGQLKLVEKKYAVLVPISNDLRRNSSLEAERVVRDDMVRIASNDEDIAFLKGTGNNGQPKGIYYWVGAAGRTNSSGTALANTRTDIRVVKNALSVANAPMVRRAWFMHSRAADYLGWEIVDANSNLVYPQMQADNGAQLAGATVYRNNNIAVTLGGGTDTELYYVEMSEFFIADGSQLEIELFNNATYADASGTLRSGVSRDESAIRLIRFVDSGMRHTESAHVIEACGWGA